MSNEAKFYVASDRSIVAPNTDCRFVAGPAGRRTKLGQRGPKLPGGTELSPELVAALMAKRESNGQSCLEHLISTGFLVTTPNTKCPISDVQSPQKVEREMTKSPSIRDRN